jgi:glutamate synthase (NADPH/NADH) small chain
MGYHVTVYEALHIPGGVLSYGIPEFRLPKSIVEAEINDLKQKGVKFMMNTVIGRTLLIDELLNEENYDAVFVGSGAGLPSFMDIEGEGLNNVYSANEFLTRINLMKAYKDNYDTPIRHHKKIAVVGGGNVAMDAARCAKRLGAEEVYIIYRRGEEEMPARHEEIEHAKEEGIKFLLLTNPTRIVDDLQGSGSVSGIECVKMELGEPDSSGRRSPKAVKGSNFIIEVDAVIMAIGTSPNPLISRTTPGLSVNKKGCLIVDETGVKTSHESVYAGGDAVTGAATVILAMGAGKQGAKEIDKYIKEKNVI